MKLLTATVTNFGSYKSLTFDYTDKGLALIYGPTGAGKSTLLDIAPWVLYGTTAKDGAVDDVRNWGAEEPTVGTIRVRVSNATYTVTRIRGLAKQNDLYFDTDFDDGKGFPTRGKDIADTQKLLEARLGVTAEQFLTSSYFHEFSKVGTFFTAKAKDRRQVFEEIADLRLAATITSNGAARRKHVAAKVKEGQTLKDRGQGRLEQLEASHAQAEEQQERWETKRAQDLNDLESKLTRFEEDKAAKVAYQEAEAQKWEDAKTAAITKLVDDLTNLESVLEEPSIYADALKELDRQIKDAKSGTRCKACQQTKRDDELLDDLDHQRRNVISKQMKNERDRGRFDDGRERLEAEYAKVNPYPEQVEAAKAAENHYAAQLEAFKEQENPFVDQLMRLSGDLQASKVSLAATEEALKTWQVEHSRLEQIEALCKDLRGELLKKTIKEAEIETNRCLEKHFDSEIRVEFETGSSDSLEVTLHGGGYACNFKQLSKGQRQLLKLSFVLAVQKAAANKVGVHFDTLFFDEALDGLDGDLKAKSFGLFEELATIHGTVLMVDHNEAFQNLFATRCHVSLTDDGSQVEIENG